MGEYGMLILNILRHAVANSADVPCTISVHLGKVLQDVFDLMTLFPQSFVIAVHLYMVYVIQAHIMCADGLNHALGAFYQFNVPHNLDRFSITCTLLPTRLISSTATTGDGRYDAPLAKATANISSPI